MNAPRWAAFGDEAPAAGVHRDHLAQLALDRTHVHHHLPAARAVERLDSHQRDGVDGGGQHHEIGFRNTLLETHDPVRKAQLQRLGSVFFGAFDPEYLLCDAVVAKGQGERASDKAQTRNQYFHKRYTYL